MVRASLQVPSIPKAIQKMMMSALPCYIIKKEEKKGKEKKQYIYIKRAKKERRD
jgi:hypothetical protein